MTDELRAKIEAKRARRIETAPVKSRGILQRAMNKTAPRSGAIKAFCLECVGFERAAVTECAAYACPLWMYRPYQKKEKDNAT